MSPCICHKIPLVVMRKKTRCLSVVTESKLQHSHPWKGELLSNRFNFGCNHSEILSNNRQFAEHPLSCRKEGCSRTLDPSAVYRSGLTCRHLPVGFDPAKMVEADHIHYCQRLTDALDPPRKAIRGHPLPVVYRVPPQLTCSAEIV